MFETSLPFTYNIINMLRYAIEYKERRVNISSHFRSNKSCDFRIIILTSYWADGLSIYHKTIVIRIIVWMTIFKSIHMTFYVNTSWACALFRNNKQHVVLGQKRNCQRVEESGLWLDSEIKRNRSEVSSKWNKCRIYVRDQLDRCRWMERTQGSATVKSHAELAKILPCSRRVHIEGHMNRFEYCHPDNNSDNDSFVVFFVKKSYLLQQNSVLIFILWRSVRKSTIILGMKKLRSW
jgi:hypothetical protein